MRTKVMARLICIYLFCTFIVGCGMTNVVSESLPMASKVKLVKKLPNEIDIYTKDSPPKKGVVLIANIGVHGNGYADKSFLENAMKKKAANIGAEFVILSDYQISNDETVGAYSGGLFMSQKIQRPHLYGVAGVYSKVYLGLFLEDDGKIRYVAANSPADKAGLKEGMKILSINGEFYHNYLVLQKQVSIRNPGEIITVEYLDDKQEKRKVCITLDSNT